ncbi:hypothetical protein AKJ09_08065 [Labilithrix luteola]|uniref:Uncharacterized protein n=1 Tax=Labilithrix luteola TaxID=1391654 RepID=A0A0K1Q6X3_9BACT|nr:hypothetical protein AKJ09_08065 [Labilithrix luteola]
MNDCGDPTTPGSFEAGADSSNTSPSGPRTDAGHDASSTDAAHGDDGGDTEGTGDGGPVQLATGLDYPWHMAVGGGYVYVVDGDGVEKIDTKTGTKTTLPSTGMYVGADATYAVWANQNGDVYQLAHTGTTPKKVGTGVATGNINSISTDGTKVYWTEFLNRGKVKAVPVDGNAVTVAEELSPALLYPSGVAFAAGSVFVAESDGNQSDGTIKKLTAGPGAAPILGPLTGPSFPVSDGTHIFWWEKGNSDRIVGASIDGTGMKTLVSVATSPTLATDGTSLYYVNASGTVSKAPVAGGIGTPTPLYTFSYHCEALAVDATSVYWADYDHGIVYKAPK